jgi:hypothetical protein
MPKTRLISPGSIPNHKLLKNLQLQGNYISNDGGDEGISIADDGDVTMTSNDTQLKVVYDASNYADISVADDGHLELATTGTDADLTLDSASALLLESSQYIYFRKGSATRATFNFQNDPEFKIFSEDDTGDSFVIQVNDAGATTMTTVDDDGADAHLTIVADGHVEFDGCAAGFDQVTASFDATNTTVDFTSGNKQHLTLTADVTNLFFKFPATSGNFLCVVLQDGTGGWNVTNFKGLDSAGNANANGAATDGGIRWAGASAPDLTETADKADILTFYWDATSANEIAYGVFSENF